ncbi:MAG: hypothetical protein NC094_12155 [Bacteroidales bacterium]|nr:hypothetical protein [Lachnoclostridium sp.]MCM1385252.1 hypothetical protein [Lachnoclostridium sp.]MCM1466162.1 hypothetical protein [Bacteroidales bacterium]
MDSLRVDSGIKKIEVNDNGEYIEIPISDTAFYEKFGALLKHFEQKQAEIEKQAAELEEKHKDKPDNDTDMIIDTVTLYSGLCKDICAELDRLFGAGCCKKVFVGIDTPSTELIGDFFEQITPLLQKYAQERNEKINLKYNRNRKGSRG